MTMRMICDDHLLDAASLGSPGIDSLRWTKPVYPGDTLSGAPRGAGSTAHGQPPDVGTGAPALAGAQPAARGGDDHGRLGHAAPPAGRRAGMSDGHPRRRRRLAACARARQAGRRHAAGRRWPTPTKPTRCSSAWPRRSAGLPTARRATGVRRPRAHAARSRMRRCRRPVWASPGDATRWPMHAPGGVGDRAAPRPRGRCGARGEPGSGLGGRAGGCDGGVHRDRRFALAARPGRAALLRLADLASHAALVLGEWVPFAPRDWSAQECRLVIGAQAPLMRRGTHSCGDPAFVLPTGCATPARATARCRPARWSAPAPGQGSGGHAGRRGPSRSSPESAWPPLTSESTCP